MYSLPLISHHLFVAALENEDRPGATEAADPSDFGPRSRPALALPLELVVEDRPLVDEAGRSLRLDPRPRGT
jgi:hypothetical protein